MRQYILNVVGLLALAATTLAQGPPDGSSYSDYNPYSSGGDDSSSSSENPYASGSEGEFGGFSFGSVDRVIMIHAICATVAFGLLFPTGGIMIRVLSFPGLWLVHGVFQIVAFVLFCGAVGCGIYMIHEAPENVHLLHNAHPIIGLSLFALLLFQPILGFIHHFAFKKYKTRTFWSYAHLWIGRICITAGIINGGLGLKLSTDIGFYTPDKKYIIIYGAAAGAMWLLYVISTTYGESKRAKARKYTAVAQGAPPVYKNTAYSHSSVQYA